MAGIDHDLAYMYLSYVLGTLCHVCAQASAQASQQQRRQQQRPCLWMCFSSSPFKLGTTGLSWGHHEHRIIHE